MKREGKSSKVSKKEWERARREREREREVSKMTDKNGHKVNTIWQVSAIYFGTNAFYTATTFTGISVRRV